MKSARTPKKIEMETAAAGGGDQPAAPVYSLPTGRFFAEDILFCVDTDAEAATEMKVSATIGRPITRLDCIKQGLYLFVNAKLTINPDHRFNFCSLSRSVSSSSGNLEGAPWLHKLKRHFQKLRKEFSNQVESAVVSVRAIKAAKSSYGVADLTQLFRMATHEARKSRAQNRIFRVVLVYCRSSTPPHHQWPISDKLFTMDVIYLHDKPSPENCPQKVYDALVDAVEHVSLEEGYTFESGQGLARVLFRQMCTLLSHPHQRCMQDDLDIPRSLARKVPQPDAAKGEDSMVVSGQ